MAIVPSDIKVALLSGGSSGEREISLASGEGAKGALEEAGFAVTMLDPANKADLVQLINGNFDVAFLTTHGRKGEDGTIQGFLEMVGLPYIGSGIQASAIAMDKIKSKVFYELADIPTAPAMYLGRGEAYDPQDIVDTLGSHCVVKPATEGSSLGVEIVEGSEALGAAIEQAFTFDSQVLVESYVSGTEITVAVLGNDDLTALPVIQIVPKNASYDFESKYAPGGSEHLCPAPLDELITAKVQDYAKLAHKALGCAGVSRTDFIIDSEGEAWVLETNTIPGMTATSLLPDAARAAGISFPELCVKLVEYALA